MSIYDETIFQMWRMDEKRCYYLMSGAGAGIGYSLATIQPDISVIQTRLLLGSLICWSASFLFGHKVVSNLRLVVGHFSITPNKLRDAMIEGLDAHEAEIRQVGVSSDYLAIRHKRFGNLQIAFLLAAAALLTSTEIDFWTVFGFPT